MRGRRPPRRSRQLRVAKSLFVADDEATAERYVTHPGGPYHFYYRSLLEKLRRSGRAGGFKTHRDMADEDLDAATIVDQLVIRGTVNRVVEQLLAFRDQVGDFGTLLYAGHDWADRRLAVRSMELMAEKVMPAVNRPWARNGRSPDVVARAGVTSFRQM